MFFVAPLYVVLAILFGGIDPILRQPVPVWNPLSWDFTQFNYVIGPDLRLRPPTSGRRWCAPSSTSASPAPLCLLIAYPVAYFTARFAGRWKGLAAGGR